MGRVARWGRRRVAPVGRAGLVGVRAAGRAVCVFWVCFVADGVVHRGVGFFVVGVGALRVRGVFSLATVGSASRGLRRMPAACAAPETKVTAVGATERPKAPHIGRE